MGTGEALGPVLASFDQEKKIPVRTFNSYLCLLPDPNAPARDERNGWYWDRNLVGSSLSLSRMDPPSDS